jgi:hypothetical protein
MLTDARAFKVTGFWNVTPCWQMVSRFGGNRSLCIKGTVTRLFYPEEVGNRILHKSGTYIPNDTASELGRS